MAYITCLDTKNFTFEPPGKCGWWWLQDVGVCLEFVTIVDHEPKG